MKRMLSTWWSTAARCWRIKDGELFTYYDLAQVVGHLREREAAALLTPPPHNDRTSELMTALSNAGITVVYS